MPSWPLKRPPSRSAGLSGDVQHVWYLYLVAAQGDYWYTGISTDVERRFAEHQAQKARCARALKGRGPIELLYSQRVGTHSTALKLELWVKSLSKQQKRAFVAGALAYPHRCS